MAFILVNGYVGHKPYLVNTPSGTELTVFFLYEKKVRIRANEIDETNRYRVTSRGICGRYALATLRKGDMVDIFGELYFPKLKYKDALEEANEEYGVSVESTQNWSGGGLLFGPYLRLPLSQKLSWDIRGSFGFYGSYSPKITIRTTLKEDESQKSE